MTDSLDPVGEYLAWLKSEIRVSNVEQGWLEIETPFLDRHNDYIAVFARRLESGHWEFSDGGETLSDLAMSGFEPDTERRRGFLNEILRGLQVELDGDQLISRDRNAGIAKNALVQAVLGVGDLHVLSKSNVRSIFYEDVRIWMDEQQLRPLANIKIDGTTGATHRFDYVFPRTVDRGERYLRLIPSPDRSKAELAAFAWVDSRTHRDPESEAIALLDDSDGAISPTVINTLEQYSIAPLFWSDKQSLLDAVAEAA